MENEFNGNEQEFKYCPKCGEKIHAQAVVCVHCGCSVEAKEETVGEDKPSTGIGILSFLFPLVGLILYLVWKNQYPIKAKSAGKCAIWGVVASIALSVISGIISACAAAAL